MASAIKKLDASSSCALLALNEVNIIEKSLDHYDKISMLFLLYDDANQALDCYNENNCNFVEVWAIQEVRNNASFWSHKIVEALCITQNYAVLRKLGFSKTDMQMRFLPNRSNTSLYINIIKKNVYITCEEMTSFQRNKFIYQLKEDFKEKSIPFKRFPEMYLELYFLYCFSIKYITLKNLSDIIIIFHKIGLKTNGLSSVQNITSNEQKYNVIRQDNIRNEGIGEKAMPYNKYTSNRSSKDECYEMSHDNAGICLIINQELFHISEDEEDLVRLVYTKKLSPRHGTNVDERHLTKTFKYFGFTTYIYRNLKRKEIIDTIKNILKEFKNTDCCFICCILSHGRAEEVFGSDSLPVQISEIEDVIHDKRYTNLLKKPKILIIQSCQGIRVQQALDITEEEKSQDNHTENTYVRKRDYIRTDGPDFTPERCDLLVCMSTITGFASIRHELDGSWYIQELCDVLRADAHRNHFADILTRVTHHIKQRSWPQEDGKILCMVPSYTSSFTKKLYFSPPVLNK